MSELWVSTGQTTQQAELQGCMYAICCEQQTTYSTCGCYGMLGMFEDCQSLNKVAHVQAEMSHWGDPGEGSYDVSAILIKKDDWYDSNTNHFRNKEGEWPRWPTLPPFTNNNKFIK